MQTSKFFQAQKIYDNVTLIIGLAGEQCYLIEGSERALLIDGLSGVGSLKAFVRELTDLPVVMALTHSHVDHVGAAFEYGKVYLHPDDMDDLYVQGDPERRFGFATMGGLIPHPFTLRFEDTVPCVPVQTFPIYEGEIFDLGGVKIEVIPVPGHTWGTVVFLDRDRRVVYSGDAVNRNTLLCLAGTSIEQYRESLLHLKTYADAFDLLWGGHGPESVPASIVDEAISLCDEILAGKDEHLESEFNGRKAVYARAKDEMFRRLDGGIANIAYSEERLWKKQIPPRSI